MCIDFRAPPKELALGFVRGQHEFRRWCIGYALDAGTRSFSSLNLDISRAQQGHIASTKEMACIIAMYDKDGDSEFDLVRFDNDEGQHMLVLLVDSTVPHSLLFCHLLCSIEGCCLWLGKNSSGHG